MTRKLTLGDYEFTMDRPLIMGVVNVTPDSFSDGGLFRDSHAAIEYAISLKQQGADIVDIGGESTRPGSLPVSAEEERARVIPVITELARQGVPVSVDTVKSSVMAESIEAGACLINDISGLSDEHAIDVISSSRVGVCVMHMQGTPRTMQDEPSYKNVLEEVCGFLRSRAESLIEAGVGPSRIILDPGFGFGKTDEHNIELLRNIQKIADLGFPVLSGLSRKSMLGRITGKEDPKDRIGASISAALLAVANGTSIIRVHDVAETHDALKVWVKLSSD